MKCVLGGQYRVCVKDLLVVVPKIQFLNYRLSYHFWSTYHCDIYITESSTKSAKLIRWLLSLQSYNVTFKYKEGRKKRGGRLPIKAGFCHRMKGTWVEKVSPDIMYVYSVVNNYCDIVY